MHISNVKLLLSELEDCKDWFYFRGYKEYKKHMTPTLGRSNLHEKELVLIRKCYGLVSDKYDFKNIKNLIEFGQHYSLPTRLLDWSLNPYIALFFAIYDKEDTDEPFFIGRIQRNDPSIKDEKALQRYPVNFKDIHGLRFVDIHDNTLGDICGFDPLLDEKINILESRIYERIFIEYFKTDNMPNITLFHYHDDFPNMRKDFQKGLFTLHKSCYEPFPKALYEELIIQLSRAEKHDVLNKLKHLGICSESILADDHKYEIQIRKIVDEVRAAAF